MDVHARRLSCAEAGFSGRHDASRPVSAAPAHRNRVSRCSERQARRSLAVAATLSAEEVLQGAVPRRPPAQRSPDVPPGDLALPSADRVFGGCEADSPAPLRVAVLLSGGVDSSLALHLLRRAGHAVTAFYLQIWFQEDFRNFWGACPWEEDLEVCRQVCEQEGVPLHVVPLTEQYWDRVVADSIGEIKRGRTPNPDILCNSRVKFGAFYEFLERAWSGSFDRVASGHYARVLRDGSGEEGARVRLALTPDALKDQTYFLAHLSQRQLARAMFPLGCLTKAEVRHLAAQAGLPNQARSDSQGICFLGKVRFEEFVRQHLGTWPGPLIDEESNTVIGFHEGFWFYTPGQRRGIELSHGPWYVSRKDCRRNAVYISRQYYSTEKSRDAFRCGGFSWISGQPPPAGRLRCKIRHGPQLYACHLAFARSGSEALVLLDGSDQGLAPGQFAVFYEGEVCLGSGVISAPLTAAEAAAARAALEQAAPAPEAAAAS